ncbi:MAG: putative bifunctional diguanylate cyclase/phosphodiesterase [bacterium]
MSKQKLVFSEIGTLVLSEDKLIQKQLFNYLDDMECAAIYNATTLEDAERLLEEEPDIKLLVIDPRVEPRKIRSWIQGIEVKAKLGLVVVLKTSRTPVNIPESLSERNAVLSIPLDLNQFAQSVQGHSHRVRKTNKPDAQQLSAEVQQLIDGLDDEVVLADPNSLIIEHANRAFYAGSLVDNGLSGNLDLPRYLLGMKRGQLEVLQKELLQFGQIQFDCFKYRFGDSPYPVQGKARLVEINKKIPLALFSFRKNEQEKQLKDVLSILHMSFKLGMFSEDFDALLSALIESLDLDGLVVISRNKSKAFILAQTGRRGVKTEEILLSNQIIKKILKGDEVIYAKNADKELNKWSFLKKYQLDCVIGLPLRIPGSNEYGALLAVGREQGEGWAQLIQIIRVMGGRFALGMGWKRNRDELEKFGRYDPLTSLPNRKAFDDSLDSALLRASRAGESLAVMFVDIDKLKSVNDSLGHDLGDRLIVGLAQRLTESIRPGDFVARYAGDEFIILLRRIGSVVEVERIASRMIESLRKPLNVGQGKELKTSASIGISLYPDDATNAESLIKHADTAMYEAKGKGGDNWQIYARTGDESRFQKLQMESQLRHAIDHNQLLVYFQPKVDAQTEDIVGMEALVRWEHPDLGLISPGFFVPLAEETGLVVPMGSWVLQQSCAYAAEWYKKHGLTLKLAVNLSAIQLMQDDLVDLIEEVLEKTGLPSQYLELEVTETINVTAIKGLKRRLLAIQALGCSIAIDDFGTGQASLEYLKRFPADCVKVDQTFVRNIGIDPDDEAIIKATVEMAHNLNRHVVAEGVENEVHLAFLRDIKCEQLQGYLFCRPISASDFDLLLTQRQNLINSQE